MDKILDFIIGIFPTLNRNALDISLKGTAIVASIMILVAVLEYVIKKLKEGK